MTRDRQLGPVLKNKFEISLAVWEFLSARTWGVGDAPDVWVGD